MTIETKTVSLGPGQSQQVGFQVVPSEAGLYQVSVNGLDGSFTTIVLPFDPWVYDVDNSCYIETAELLRASNDRNAGLITNNQFEQVRTLWEDKTRNPACLEPVINYSGKRVWCAYRFYHELPGREATTWVVTGTTGRIGNLSVELTKAGLTGVEATFKIRTGGETSLEFITLEVLGWWQYGKFITGVTIYDYNKPSHWGASRKIDFGAGETLRYTVSVVPGGALTRIWNSANVLVFEYLYECNAKRIVTFQTELEYWRYYEVIDGNIVIREGRFLFSGEVILERLYREGVGWLNSADVLSFPSPSVNGVLGIAEPKDLMSYDHYKQGGNIVFKGRVVDVA